MLEAYVCLFFIGSFIGYFLELFYRHIGKNKWINPGFLMGPYLPIYGFGLCSLCFIYNLLIKFNCHLFVIVIIMGIFMTLIEFIVGFIFTKFGKIKLWDYSNNFLNYKGIICLRFSIYWTFICLIYCAFFADTVSYFILWYSKCLKFTFILGMLFATIIIDFCYSSKVMIAVRKYARSNKIVVRYEELKGEIKEFKKSVRQKSSFLFPFSGNLVNYLEGYHSRRSKDKKGLIHLFKK